MSLGDVLLDSEGNVILDDDGNVMLDDGTGSGCCCLNCDAGISSGGQCVDCAGGTSGRTPSSFLVIAEGISVSNNTTWTVPCVDGTNTSFCLKICTPGFLNGEPLGLSVNDTYCIYQGEFATSPCTWGAPGDSGPYTGWASFLNTNIFQCDAVDCTTGGFDEEAFARIFLEKFGNHWTFTIFAVGVGDVCSPYNITDLDASRIYLFLGFLTAATDDCYPTAPLVFTNSLTAAGYVATITSPYLVGNVNEHFSIDASSGGTVTCTPCCYNPSCPDCPTTPKSLRITFHDVELVTDDGEGGGVQCLFCGGASTPYQMAFDTTALNEVEYCLAQIPDSPCCYQFAQANTFGYKICEDASNCSGDCGALPVLTIMVCKVGSDISIQVFIGGAKVFLAEYAWDCLTGTFANQNVSWDPCGGFSLSWGKNGTATVNTDGGFCP